MMKETNRKPQLNLFRYFAKNLSIVEKQKKPPCFLPILIRLKFLSKRYKEGAPCAER